jgi:hypothetical protein
VEFARQGRAHEDRHHGQQGRPLPQRPAVPLEVGLLPIEIKAIISNHREFYQLAASYNIPSTTFP